MTVFVYTEALFQIAYAITVLVYHHVGLSAARHAIVVHILAISEWADAITVFIANLTFLNWTHIHCNIN